MNFIFDFFYNIGNFFGGSIMHRFGTQESLTETSNTKQNWGVIFKCLKLLSENVAIIPISVNKNGFRYDKHRYTTQLSFAPNSYQNSQFFWQTIETHRGTYGNAFVDIRKADWIIIHPETVEDYKIENGILSYKINPAADPELIRIGENKNKKAYWIKSKDTLHFRAISTNGVFGISPITAAALNLDIQNKAYSTIINFYKNNATTTMAMKSKIDTPSIYKAFKEEVDNFNNKQTGIDQAGKVVPLPINTELTPLGVKFVDAELINTLKFTRDEIMSMYGIPSFMVNDKEVQQMDIENQSMAFRFFTIAPIIAGYKAELEMKLLTVSERRRGYTIDYNTDVLIEISFKNKIEALGMALAKGVYTPEEVAAKAGSRMIPTEFGKYHYIQTQNVPVERYGEYSAFAKNEKPSDNSNKEEQKEDKN
jgi:HK97 family phage portal protein